MVIKLGFILALASLVSSCANPYYSVATKDGRRQDYRIISVRDSSLVLLRQGEELTPEGIQAFGKIVPFDSIEGIHRESSLGIEETLIGTFTGFFVGGLIGAASYSPPATKPSSLEPGFESGGIVDLGGIKAFGTGAAIGFLGGGLTGFLLRPPEKDLYPIPGHYGELIQASRYPHDEPEWLRQMR